MHGAMVDAVSDHLEKNVGPVKWVMHEEESEYVHIDVYCIGPSKERPFVLFATSGMSELPMKTPKKFSKVPKYAEVLIQLPRDWNINEKEIKKEKNYWPVRLLKMIARLPHEDKTWIGKGHTVDFQQISKTIKFPAVVIFEPFNFPKQAATFRFKRRKISFFSVMPIYREELEIAESEGSYALYALFEAAGIRPIFDRKRANVALCKH